MELPEDEVPAADIWHHPQRMAEWNEARKAKNRAPGSEPVPGVEEKDETRNQLVLELMGE